MTRIDHERISRIAHEARSFLEERWERLRILHHWPQQAGQTASDGMCLFSACFLRFVLRAEFPDAGWRVVGGSIDKPYVVDPTLGMPGGCRDAAGRWHGHHWTENAGGDLAVDVTLDQFGGEEVRVGDPRRPDQGSMVLLRRNWLFHEERAAVDEVAAEVYGWMSDWDFTHPVGWSTSDGVQVSGTQSEALSVLDGLGLSVVETDDGYHRIGIAGVPGFVSPQFPTLGSALRWTLDHPEKVRLLNLDVASLTFGLR